MNSFFVFILSHHPLKASHFKANIISWGQPTSQIKNKQNKLALIWWTHMASLVCCLKAKQKWVQFKGMTTATRVKNQRQNKCGLQRRSWMTFAPAFKSNWLTDNESVRKKNTQESWFTLLTSCSGNANDSEMWALWPDRRGRQAAECGWYGPMSGTRADEPEGNPRHIWRGKCEKSGQAKKRSSGAMSITWKPIYNINQDTRLSEWTNKLYT